MTNLNSQQQKTVVLRLLQIKILLVEKMHHGIDSLWLIILKGNGRILGLLEITAESGSKWLRLGTDDALVEFEKRAAALYGHICVFAILKYLGVQRQETRKLRGRHGVGGCRGQCQYVV